MANQYLYGTYGQIGKTIAKNAIQAGTVIVYFGTIAVNLVRGYASANIINKPVKLYNLQDAQRKVGYSADWKAYTLCEAVTAHFENPIGNIGPITVINVLDPDVHRAAELTERAIGFNNGNAEFKSDKIILDTLALDGLVEGTDYALDYNYARGAVVITSLQPDSPISGSVDASYYEIEADAIAAEDIIGGINVNGKYSGLGALQVVYTNTYDIPNIISAPGWSHIPSVYNAMTAASQQINGHWNAFVLADIPIAEEGTLIDTISKAKAWKLNHGYDSEFSKVYWPMGKDALGRSVHLSTLAGVTMLSVDTSNNHVPMETPGNKQVAINKLYFGEASVNQGYDQRTANQLTAEGISTAVFWGGTWVLWGDHTAAYSYGADLDPRVIFDVSVRMLMHITNSFQREWSPTIDKPMNRQLTERIINREQEKLDALVSVGALIGNPEVSFISSENNTEDVMNGDFRWDIAITPTPPLKSASVFVAYTDAGFSVYFDEGSEEE